MADQKNRRTSMDVLRDLSTIRSGSMPKGDTAPKKTAAPAEDPVEVKRLEMQRRRNRGELKDVNLPAPPRRY